MKYNTTYTPKTSFKETVKFTDFVRKEIYAYFNKNFKATNIMTPINLPSDNLYNAEFEKITRDISFDSGFEYEVGVLALTDTPYLRNMVLKTGLKNNEALVSENTFIWRDLPENPASTIAKHEITLQAPFDNTKYPGFVRQIASEIYDLIFFLAEEAKRKLSVENIYPPYVPYITPQTLENEFGDKDFKEREIEMIMEKDAFIFENPGTKILSGHIHTYLPLSQYNLENFYQIILKDRVNSYVLKVASVAEVAMGQKLAEQIQNNASLKSSKEFIVLTESDLKIVEVKINLPRLMMAILGKGHISEVQPGVYTTEEKVVTAKYKIETY